MTEAGSNPPEWMNQRLPLAETGLTLRLARLDDLSDEELSAILELLTVAFNGAPEWFSIAPTPLDHLQWKARDRLLGAWLQLIEDGDRLVGFSLNSFCNFQLKGAQIVVRQGFDSALHPEFQGRGINSARRNRAERDRINSTSCLSISLAMHPTSLTRRGTSPSLPFGNTIDTLVKPLGIRRIISARRAPQSGGRTAQSRTRSVIEARQRKLPSALNPGRILLAGRLIWSMLKPSNSGPHHTPWDIRTIEHFDETVDDFWVEAAQPFDFIQTRDRTYLNWRYCDPAGGSFTVRVAQLDGAMLGYAVLRINPDGAILGDLLTLPDRTDVAESLVADAIQLARDRGVPQLRAWMPQTHPYRALLDDLGFIKYRTPLQLVYTPRTCDPADLESLQHPQTSIHFMTADTDHM
jgi:GNAT superfamily N-acetyltransferase